MGINYKELNGFKLNPIGIGTWGIGGYMERDVNNDKEDMKQLSNINN